MNWLIKAWHHRLEIGAAFAAALVAWTPVATLLARFIPRPGPQAHWAKRALFDLFVDTPAWAAALGRSGILGGVFNVPGVPSRTPSDNPTPAASKMMRISRMSDETGRVHPARRPGEGPLIALLIASALTMALAALSAGCGTAGAKALARCEMNTLPQQLEGLLVRVAAAAFTPGTDWQAQMEQAAVGAAPAQVSCVAQALTGFLEDAMSAKKGAVDYRYQEAHRRMKAYLAAHPKTSCAPGGHRRRLYALASLIAG